MSEINNKVSSKENNSAKNNSKKRKIGQENIEDFAKKKHKKRLKLNEEEIKKFLLIFQELVSIANEEESSLEEEGGGSVDGAVSILSILAQWISEPLEDDIDSLEFPKIAKKSLETLKAILGVFNTVKNNIKSTLKADGKN